MYYIVFNCFWLWYVLQCFYLLKVFWCPCMAINVSVQFNDGLLPDIILLTLFESLSRTVTCIGELSALIRVIPRGRS